MFCRMLLTNEEILWSEKRGRIRKQNRTGHSCLWGHFHTCNEIKWELTFVLWRVFIETTGHWTRWHTAVSCMVSPFYLPCPLCNRAPCGTECGSGKRKQAEHSLAEPCRGLLWGRGHLPRQGPLWKSPGWKGDSHSPIRGQGISSLWRNSGFTLLFSFLCLDNQ